MSGKVYLVGAGPGDPELLTVRAWRLVSDADVLLHDALTGSEILDDAPTSAEVRDVGKRPGPDGERTTQEEINSLMVRKARAGNDVVRLKGGDPTVFGRGGEEATHLAEAGVPVEIVPGVTSAVAAPGIVGIPLTHRERASSVTVVTGHEDPTKDESALDWAALADTVTAGGTLVVLMGVGRLPDNVAALRDHGVAPGTPVAMVEKATWDDERTVSATLDAIVEEARAADVSPPAVTVVGDVVSVRDRVAAALDRDSASADESETTRARAGASDPGAAGASEPDAAGVGERTPPTSARGDAPPAVGDPAETHAGVPQSGGVGVSPPTRYPLGSTPD
jgi:uroporphyrin-III C-methyltransferase